MRGCQDNQPNAVKNRRMSKILVFAPQRMIQQAIVLSLFSDHDVQLCVGLGENSSPAVNDFDLAIVDATALRNV